MEFKVIIVSTGQIRLVNVPYEELTNDIDDILNNIYRYGQNDFQRRQCPSVSVGDLIITSDDAGNDSINVYRVDFAGFTKLVEVG